MPIANAQVTLATGICGSTAEATEQRMLKFITS